MSDIEQNKAICLCRFFETAIEKYSDSSKANYRVSLRYFVSFLKSKGISLDGLTRNILAEWIIDMFIKGMSIPTILYNLKLVSYLYHSAMKSGIIEHNDIFKVVIADLRVIAESTDCDKIITDERFSRFVNFLRLPVNRFGDKEIIFDILRLYLFNRGMGLRSIVMLTKTDVDSLSPESAEIAGRYVSSIRKYLFPLNQGRTTAKKIEQHLLAEITFLLYSGNRLLGTDVIDCLDAYWSFAAINCGVPAAKVAAIVGRVPSAMPLLGLFDQSEISCVEQNCAEAAVARLLADDTIHWFAMQLRPSVKYETLMSRIDSLGDSCRRPEVFYPFEEICRRVGKKILRLKKPIINNVVFFRSRMTDVYPLFLNIGDLAWCFTSSRGKDSSYAIIPDVAMSEFMTAIGGFNPEYEVGEIGSIDIKEGDEVILLGSLFGEREVTLTSFSSKTDTRGRTIYRIAFFSNDADGSGLEWCVDVRPSQIKKAEA